MLKKKTCHSVAVKVLVKLCWMLLASQGLALDVELRASEMDHVPIRNFSTEKQFSHEPF